MSETAGRERRFYPDDMIGFAEKVLAYTRGLDAASFAAGGLNYDATLCKLEPIGEAATHVPDAVRQAHTEIPWRPVIATRNRHGIDNDTLWSIVRDVVPNLLRDLRAMREQSA